MSNEVPDNDLNLDQVFLPAWAQESPAINRYADYEGERGDRGDRRFNDKRPRRGPRPGGGGGGAGGGGGRGDRPPGRSGDRPPQGGRRPVGGKARQPGRGGGRSFDRPQEVPPPEVNLNLVPDDRGVDSLAKQIRVTGRAYPLFDVGRLILQKDERFNIEFSVKKRPDGSVIQPLFVYALDDTVWLSEESAVEYVLDKHLETFYQIEKIPTDPPKGTYTFVAQCGMSGIILGPPNYHDYQNKLHRLHQERFARMPFDLFKSRVKIVRDEEVVKKWIDEQSFRTEYNALNVPEPLKLGSFEEVQQHFRETHLAAMVKPVETHLLPGSKSRRVGARDLQRFVLQTIDDQRRFPLKLVTTLSNQFASRGLQFFKVNKTIVHVSVSRPHYLDVDTSPVSDGVKKIVHYVNEHNRCSVKDLVDALAPTPAAPTPSAAPEPAPGEAGDAVAPHHPEATPEQKKVLSDLHWLVHQGHVIEFANGALETAKKPLPKPPGKKKEPAPKPADAQPEATGETVPVAASGTPSEAAPVAPASEAAPIEPPVELPAPAEEPKQPDQAG